MQRIVTPQQMVAMEQQAFAQGISPYALMECAATCVADALDISQKALFVCGSGNNGGDGLAAARLFHTRGGSAAIFMPDTPKTPGAILNADKARHLGIPFVDGLSSNDDIIIDALMGIGFHGTLNPAKRELVEQINSFGLPVLAVDVPSGLDAGSGEAEVCIHAARTITFQCMKRGLVLTPHHRHIGDVIIADIGLSAYVPSNALHAAEATDLSALLPPRPLDVHKGDCGRVLLLCGSMGMAGAAAMAALGALRGGAGLVTIACPPNIMPILQTLVPNAMCVAVQSAVQAPPAHDVLVLGCGLPETEEVWQQILSLYRPEVSSVWDAGALNLLARHDFTLGPTAIITPHLGEAARLLQCAVQDVAKDPVRAAQQLHQKYRCAVALKSAVTTLYDGQQTALNVVGSPALAKGGSGDALAGTLAALLKEKSPFDAAQTACLWHGMAGQYACAEQGDLSVLTTDVLDALGKVRALV